MTGNLRSISVTVEEPAPGAFHWLLLEIDDAGTWSVLESSDKAFKKYHKALAAGLLALQGLIKDGDVGPRELKSRARAPKPSIGSIGFDRLL